MAELAPEEDRPTFLTKSDNESSGIATLNSANGLLST